MKILRCRDSSGRTRRIKVDGSEMKLIYEFDDEKPIVFIASRNSVPYIIIPDANIKQVIQQLPCTIGKYLSIIPVSGEFIYRGIHMQVPQDAWKEAYDYLFPKTQDKKKEEKEMVEETNVVEDIQKKRRGRPSRKVDIPTEKINKDIGNSHWSMSTSGKEVVLSNTENLKVVISPSSFFDDTSTMQIAIDNAHKIIIGNSTCIVIFISKEDKMSTYEIYKLSENSLIAKISANQKVDVIEYTIFTTSSMLEDWLRINQEYDILTKLFKD